MASSRKQDISVDRQDVDRNPDPITGEAGSHPIGTGIGAAAAGAAATGAAVGLGAGPIGAVIGAAVGAIAGGLAGKAATEAIDPTTEDAYWRENYRSRSYYDASTSYDDMAPAYRYGWESRSQHADRSWDEVEGDLARGWDHTKTKSKIGWEKAKLAARDAWDRVERTLPGDADRDGR
jgi:uncharacterized protein YcfJ